MPYQMTAEQVAEERQRPVRCWVPDCQNNATVEDWAGWKWCDDHKDSHSGEGGYKPLVPTTPEQ